MTQPPPTTTTGPGADRSDVAQEQGREVADHARQQSREVADTARQEAERVTQDARSQVADVANEARDELQAQAERETQRASGALNGVGERLQALAEGRPEEAGPVGDYAETAATQVQQLAQRVDELGFEGVVEETQRFARRRPGAFLLGAAAAGLAASRMARGAKEQQDRTRSPAPADGRARTGTVQTPRSGSEVFG